MKTDNKLLWIYKSALALDCQTHIKCYQDNAFASLPESLCNSKILNVKKERKKNSFRYFALHKIHHHSKRWNVVVWFPHCSQMKRFLQISCLSMVKNQQFSLHFSLPLFFSSSNEEKKNKNNNLHFYFSCTKSHRIDDDYILLYFFFSSLSLIFCWFKYRSTLYQLYRHDSGMSVRRAVCAIFYIFWTFITYYHHISPFE